MANRGIRVPGPRAVRAARGAARVRSRLGRTPLGAAKRRLLRQPAWPWSRVEDIDGEPQLLSDWRFFGVLGTWNEEDVVESCVRNAITQGCEQIYLVDNDSDDETVDRAVAAGAVLARQYTTRVFDEGMRTRLMQEVVEEVSAGSGAPHVWWLWLDADEFPHGRSGLTLRQQLETLDRRFRILGAQWLNHYPSGPPQFRPGRHPLDYQPLAEHEPAYGMCELGHLKHPLQRWDAGGPTITCGSSFHGVFAKQTLSEPRDSVIAHHFPFLRDEAALRARLAKFCEPGGRIGELDLEPSDHEYLAGQWDTGHYLGRLDSLGAAYRGRWAEVVNAARGTKGVRPQRWTDLVDAADTVVARWY